MHIFDSIASDKFFTERRFNHECCLLHTHSRTCVCVCVCVMCVCVCAEAPLFQFVRNTPQKYFTIRLFNRRVWTISVCFGTLEHALAFCLLKSKLHASLWNRFPHCCNTSRKTTHVMIRARYVCSPVGSHQPVNVALRLVK